MGWELNGLWGCFQLNPFCDFYDFYDAFLFSLLLKPGATHLSLAWHRASVVAQRRCEHPGSLGRVLQKQRLSSPSLPIPADNTCRFEDEKICGFVQDKMDNFDWTRQNALTQNPKRTVNTGPPTDISGTPEGWHTSGFPSAGREGRCTPSPVRSLPALGESWSAFCFTWGAGSRQLICMLLIGIKHTIKTPTTLLKGRV